MDSNIAAAVIVYHKNASKIYPQRWIKKCTDSILNQTYQNFYIFELEYGDGSPSVFPSELPNHTYIKKPCINFVEAMNYLLNLVFKEKKYQCCFNVNLDDYYAQDRFERQIRAIKKGADIVSSNIAYVNENDKILRYIHFSSKHIKTEAYHGNNIVAHPVVCYSRNFWMSCGKGYDINAIPAEDFVLWKRTMNRFKFIILPEFLCFHRIHSNKVCANPNNR